ncbi:MAG: hypothetical protein KME43_01265 [Myxacorys chilensis ATA2-1-KO14]|jgi:hypothetical protein|nr:hypothetical protein [Myxacorys chilensis ATA2-1-KO14]
MTLQELQKQVLQLSIRDRWQLVQAVLTSLQEDTRLEVKPKNLSRLRGIAKNPTALNDTDNTEDYVTYLTQKYQ